MRTKGYGSYRGRSKFKTFLKILAVTLVILIVLLFALGVYLQQFLVVSSDGVRLELPFFRRDEAPPQVPTAPVTEEPVVVVTPTPTPEPVVLNPVPVSQDALLDGTAADLVAAAGGNAALLDMKADSGMLGYVSGLDLAQTAKVSAAEPGLNQKIEDLTGGDLYTIARVSCFKDHELTNGDRSLAIFTNSGYRWTDPEGIRWISPTNPDVRDYVTAVCAELARLGFDEILLDHAGYPSQGNLGYIKKGEAYDVSQFSTVIGDFYQQVARALAPYDVKLSVVTTAEALAGTDLLTGQTPENLRADIDHLWVRGEDGGLTMVEDPAS